MILRYCLSIFTLLNFAITPLIAQPSKEPIKRPVLMIVIDDLRDTVGYMESFAKIETPHIDRLAASGMRFTNAHCAAPACNPSRVAVFSGLRPSTTGIYENGQGWPKDYYDHITLTQEFMKQGYYVAGSGKNYHGQGKTPNWHAYWNPPFDKDYGKPGDPLGKPLDVSFEEMPDTRRADYTIEKIKAAPKGPVFFSIGLVKPHLPFNVPREYFEKFPLDSISLPPSQENDLSDIPALGQRIAKGHGELDGRLYHDHVMEHHLWKKNIQAYLACVAYVDDVVGRIMEAWDNSPYAEDGVVILWSDHGWHLGEKNHWSKFTLWRVGTRVPFIVRAPGISEPGTTSGVAVNLVDIFPTLLEATGLPPRRDLDGFSLVPLLRNPELSWPGSVTYHGHGNASVHSGKWHAIYYRDPGARELYNLEVDPNEFNNLADQYETDPQIKQVLDSLYIDNLRSFADPAPFGGDRESKVK